jgi:hopanoid biosynthesis associated protein HpnK
LVAIFLQADGAGVWHSLNATRRIVADKDPSATPQLPRRRLIINADDFGRSASINEAVMRAHRQGVLTSASLMVNEPGFEEAVAMARGAPRLGVGLHLTLLCGHSALSRREIPGLIRDGNQFSESPAGTGFRYFFKRSLRWQLRDEIRAQFDKFRRTGLTMDHVNGHLHMHLHPVIFGILMADTEKFRIDQMRLTFDPFILNARISAGHWFYRLSHAVIHHCLAGRARPVLRRRGIRHTQRVFGLLQNERVDEDYVLKLLHRLPAGDSELYSHPSLDEFRNEFEALISPRARVEIEKQGIELIRYQDL